MSQRRPQLQPHSGEKWLHLRAALSSSLVTRAHSPNSFTETSHHLPSAPQRQRERAGGTCYKRHSYGSVDIYWPHWRFAIHFQNFQAGVSWYRLLLCVVAIPGIQTLATGAHPIRLGENKWTSRLRMYRTVKAQRLDFLPQVYRAESSYCLFAHC